MGTHSRFFAFLLALLQLTALSLPAFAEDHLPVSLAFALPPDEAEYYVLRDFKLKLLTSNLRSFYEWHRMVGRALPGTKAAMTYFVWRNDTVGQSAAWRAIEASRRGVDVTVIVDGLASFGKKHQALWSAMAREGVKISLYNPPVLKPHLANLRTHSKALQVQTGPDLSEAIWEGRNMTEHYRLGDELIDTSVRVSMTKQQGEAIFDRQFGPMLLAKGLTPWVPPRSYDHATHLATLLKLKDAADFIEDLFKTELTKEADYPELAIKWGVYLRNEHGRLSLRKYIETQVSRADSLTFANAYLVPQPSMLKALKDMIARGKTIRGFTNSWDSTKHTNVIHLMKATVSTLLAKGLDLFVRRETRDPATREIWKNVKREVHAKATIINGNVVSIGSDNWDFRNDLQNGLVFESPIVAKMLEDFFTRSLNNGEFEFANKISNGTVRNYCMNLLVKPFKWFF